jgi:hypothetical protein
MAGVLRRTDPWDDFCSDYVLDEDATSCWITVNNISVYVRRTDEGVVVDLFPLGHENDDPSLATAYAFFEEAEQ